MCMGPPTFYSYFAFIAWVYPHVYGATSESSRPCRPIQGLSPCVWGHPPLAYTCSGCAGSIPICTGPPPSPPSHAVPKRVYPHVYGATHHSPLHPQPVPGLSPCVWGHQIHIPHECFCRGSIPMCMGPPCKGE